jgi:alpha-1,2-glucosyltransferase
MVYFNTVVHPFLLADNRHYTFYVVRILMLRHWSVKYLAIPTYLLCGWLVIFALGGTAKPRRGSIVATMQRTSGPDTVHVSFVIVWLISTTLSLVTAPLIEPRYFIIPWLIWRLQLPETPQQPTPQPVEAAPSRPNGSAHKPSESKLQISPTTRQQVLAMLSQYSPHIELAWYMVINLSTCWMFLYKSFTWPQEPGKEQRFLW